MVRLTFANSMLVVVFVSLAGDDGGDVDGDFGGEEGLPGRPAL